MQDYCTTVNLQFSEVGSLFRGGGEKFTELCFCKYIKLQYMENINKLVNLYQIDVY